MQSLKVLITDFPEINHAKLIYFEGDFDGYAPDENIAEVQSVVDHAEFGSKLIFDFSRLNYLNSFAIGQLVSWRNGMTSKQGDIFMVGANKNIQDIFSVLGIGNVFKQFSDLNDVKKDLR